MPVLVLEKETFAVTTVKEVLVPVNVVTSQGDVGAENGIVEVKFGSGGRSDVEFVKIRDTVEVAAEWVWVVVCVAVVVCWTVSVRSFF